MSVVNHEITAVSFSSYSAKEILDLSVKKITSSTLLDTLGNPVKGGLYDPALGPTDRGVICPTCHNTHPTCPGHFGHIELPSPVFNPLYFKTTLKLLSSCCAWCGRLRVSETTIAHFKAKLTLLHAGLVMEASLLDEHVSSRGILRSKSADSVARDNKNQNEDDEDEDAVMKHESDESDSEGEGEERVLRRIEKYVARALENVPRSGSNYTTPAKTTLMMQHLRIAERSFLASIAGGLCPHCRGVNPGFRTEGDVKIFEKDLSPKQKAQMDARALTRVNVDSFMYVGEKATSIKHKKKANDEGENAMDIDDSSSVSSESIAEYTREATEVVATESQATQISQTSAKKDRLVLPLEVLGRLRCMWSQDKELFDLLYGSVSIEKLRERAQPKLVKESDPEMFFIQILPVTPNKFRPPSKMDDKFFEHPQNGYLTAIIKSSQLIATLIAQQKSQSPSSPEHGQTSLRIITQLIQLQSQVNYLIDSSKAPLAKGKAPAPGIRQTLEKKEGLFRKHMMGKRVNYAARSVISPDVNLETNEIGIPPVFARKLSYPTPVTPHNYSKLRQMVINGPEVWPGASHVQNEDGTLVNLGLLDKEGREAVANTLLATGRSKDGSVTHINKKVFRHLLNGDFLLLNRQPTLHKPSIMAHTARVLPGEKTIRMHYANCNTYNADFDGDEMNVHFVQNEIARAEAMLIARNDMQYLVPTDGGVLRGLIQDHVIAAVDMCSRDTWLSREDYNQLVYTALRPDDHAASMTSDKAILGDGRIEPKIEMGRNGRIITLEPSIQKPYPMWSGKQVISTILINLTASKEQLNMTSKCRVAARYWGPTGTEEQKVTVMDGHMLTGVLDKSQLGASAYGLVHAVYELYGAAYSGKLLSIFSRLLTFYLQMIAKTCRMDDLRLTETGDKIRRSLIEKSKQKGTEVAKEYVGLTPSSQDQTEELNDRLGDVIRSDEKMAGWDSAMKSAMNSITSEIISSCIPDHLLRTFPKNNMQLMTVTGAKGSNVNVSQISCLLGQQELEGRRVPTMVSGKTLPSFLPFDTSARAGGYVTGRFLTGVKPQEYFFHCMAGREGLIDTAVKTARSGYLQRCLIKHLEGLKVHYDHTVRDEDGSVYQFHYGEDSLDVTKQKYLWKFDFNAMNFQALISKYRPAEMLDSVDLSTAAKQGKKIRKKLKKSKDIPDDPLLNKWSPSRYVGSVSEEFDCKLDDYIEKNPDGVLLSSRHDNDDEDESSPMKKKDKSDKMVITAKKFRSLMHLIYMRSLVEAGESVGLLAAQSIGEPSTQMTLNTFHFAGFGAKNVTLGIPRLREIIMTASASIKTPMMTLPLRDGHTEADADFLSKRLSKVVMSQIMENVTVSEMLTSKSGSSDGTRWRKYTIRLDFWDEQDIQDEFYVSTKDLETVLEKRFVKLLETAIAKELKGAKRTVSKGGANVDEDELIGVGLGSFDKSASPAADEGDEDAGDKSKSGSRKSGSKGKQKSTAASESEDEDGDATATARAQKQKQHASYDAPDSDDEEVIQQANEILNPDESDSEPREADDDERDEDGNTSRDRVLEKSTYIVEYKFDSKNGKFCQLDVRVPADSKKLLMVSLVEKVVQAVVVREVKSISRAFLSPNETSNDTTIRVGTEGVNLRGVWEFADMIDINHIYTNDIAAILRTYGVEAGRAAIMKEIAGVFGVYGISVDTRHLSLIADYMTFEGGYKPFNRVGIATNPSPFAQMSFETTTAFLTTAVQSGDYDTLQSPSARIVLGKPINAGTGAFETLQALDLSEC